VRNAQINKYVPSGALAETHWRIPAMKKVEQKNIWKKTLFD